MSALLPRRAPGELVAATAARPDAALAERVGRIVDDVEARGEAALREHAEALGDVAPGGALWLERARLEAALAGLPDDARALLERTAARIERWARAQRAALGAPALAQDGARTRLEWSPVARAGCYAPGGRFPLPSSVLMTAVTARVAGVPEVWVASPRPAAVTLAAAAVAGADGLLAVGGAQAIAALAFGAGPLGACDVVVGPGNRWVTEAKRRLAGRVGIDMLAGPSELVVVADASADPALVAADLLAQAEHDVDARVTLLALDAGLLGAVERALELQLADLPTADTARASLARGAAVLCADLDQARALCERLAPEHLELHLERARELDLGATAWGGLFLGAACGEVLGDYGAGPNHVLPTAGGGRFRGGLSVLDFLRARTVLEVEDAHAARALYRDARDLARLEGLEAHARAAERRLDAVG